MSDSSKSRKILIRHVSATPEETFRKNTKKAMQARTERPPEDFGASEMGFGGADMQENKMKKKIRIIREQTGKKPVKALNEQLVGSASKGLGSGAKGLKTNLNKMARAIKDLQMSYAGDRIAAVDTTGDKHLRSLTAPADKVKSILQSLSPAEQDTAHRILSLKVSGWQRVRDSKDLIDSINAVADYLSLRSDQIGETLRRWLRDYAQSLKAQKKKLTTFRDVTPQAPKDTPKKDSMVADKKPEGDPTVAAVQSGLIAVDIDVGKDGADGLMGPNTRRAIRQFQQQALGSSGAFGPRSARALINAIESNPGRKAMYAMTLSKLREFEKTRKTLKASQRRTKKGKPAAPKAPEAPEEERSVGDPEQGEIQRRPGKSRSAGRGHRIVWNSKNWAVYDDVTIDVLTGERQPTDKFLNKVSADDPGLAARARRASSGLQAPANESFQLTVGDLKRIINEELKRLDEQANNPNAVKAVQAALNMLGYPQAHIGHPLAVDGGLRSKN